MLHIINGESTAGTLRQSCIEGEKISFRDALICGPTPSEVSGDGWHRIRSLHLSDYYQAHLQRFPSLQNGLGRIENKSLELINHGLHRFVDLFPKFGESEHIYGLGDFQFWISLKRLAQVSTPLVSVNGNGGIGKLNSDVLREIDFEITDTGRAVLSQEADFVRLNGIDHWLGGVHLAGRGKLWRWDSVSEALVRERRSMA